MINNFKFLKGQDDDSHNNSYMGPSWMWSTPDMYEDLRYEVVSEMYFGIDEFINQFPDGFIVMVIAIEGPNNNRRNYLNQYNPEDGGWGFDIVNDLISIDWIRILPQ